jgi:hypothetical protein
MLPLPSGIFRLDVRGTIPTDDGELVYTSYSGVAQISKEQMDRLNAGQDIEGRRLHFITAPMFTGTLRRLTSNGVPGCIAGQITPWRGRAVAPLTLLPHTNHRRKRAGQLPPGYRTA